MRVLVVGTVPPPGGEAAARLGAVAAELVAAGESVEVLSPDARSAAHRHARLTGPLLALQLALLARRYDAVVLDLAPGMPLAPTADRVTRGITLAALGAAVRAYGEVTVRLPSPIPLPGGVGGRATQALWSKVGKVVVENEDDRERVVAAPGIDAAAVVVEPPAGAGRATAERGFGGLHVEDPELRTRVQAIVRERAASDRRVNRASAALGRVGPLDDSGDPFLGQALPVTRPTVLETARIAAGRARRLALRAARTAAPSRART